MISERKTRIERAKELWPITRLWVALGLPGEPKIGSCRSPFKAQSKRDNFLITENDQGWVDFVTGLRGDAVDFIEQALGLTTAGAMMRLLEMAGLEDQPKDGSEPRPVEHREIIQPADFVEYKTAKEVDMPTLYMPTEEEVAIIAKNRGLLPEAVRQAADDGILWVGEVKDKPAWVLTDASRCNAQARRMDGELWFGELKALTIKGSNGSWPVGIAEAYQKGGLILVCEGGPDMLAGYQLLQESGLHGAPIAFLGASHRKVHPGAKPFIAGSRICIIPHNDSAGLMATYGSLSDRNHEWTPGWVETLTECGAKVSVKEIPMPTKDLNDYVKILLVHRPKML